MPILIPLILLAGAGVGVVVALALASVDRPVPVHEPDLPPNAPPPAGFPKSTGYKLVDKILPLLKQAADSSKVALGLLVGWICAESGGKIGETTAILGHELGYFQLSADERKATGFTDTNKISTDPVYSINAGLALIAICMGDVRRLGIAPVDSTFFWKLTKLVHCVGNGGVKKIVAMAQDAGEAKTWARLKAFALAHESEILHAVKHSPTKWFNFVDDRVYKYGAPFGFGSQDTIVGAAAFNDIVDPLDVLKRM